MTASAVPDPAELIRRVQSAMEDTQRHLFAYIDSGGPPRGKVFTPALTRPIWEMGFDYPCVYPKAKPAHLGEGATSFLKERLSDRGVSTANSRRDDFTSGEFQYDLAWLEYRQEHLAVDRVPELKRVVLALESEIGGAEGVFYDFNKLLGARAELRVMVWDIAQLHDGFDKLESRLHAAEASDQGYWLLSSWGWNMGFEHRVYHDGQRIKELEATPEHARER